MGFWGNICDGVRFYALLFFLYSLQLRPLRRLRLCSWIKRKLTPNKKQIRTGIASANKFVSDLAFKNMHIILPSSLSSWLSYEQLQALEQKSSLMHSIITWAALTTGQMAAIKHLEPPPGQDSIDITEQSLACFITGCTSAIIFRVATDYVLMLDPTAGMLSSTFFIITLITGPIITVKTSYLLGGAAQRVVRAIKYLYLRSFRKKIKVEDPVDFLVLDGTGAVASHNDSFILKIPEGDDLVEPA